MIVFDSSTLVLLAKVEILKEIIPLYEIVIPEIVKQESIVKRELLDAKIIRRYIEEGRIKVSQKINEGLVRQLKKDFNIEEGEASAISLAKELSTLLAIDDGLGIKACKVIDVGFITAIHFLIKLYEDGRLTEELALAKLKRIEEFGRYKSIIIDDAGKRIKEGG